MVKKTDTELFESFLNQIGKSPEKETDKELFENFLDQIESPSPVVPAKLSPFYDLMPGYREPDPEMAANLKAAGQTIKGLLFGEESLPVGLGLLQKPAEKVADMFLGMTPEEEKQIQQKYPNLSALRYAGASLLPGGQMAASAEDRERFKKMPIELQRAAITGGAIPLAAGAAAFKWIPEGLLKAFPGLSKPVLQFLSEKFPKASLKIKRLLLRNADQMRKAGMTEGQIIREMKRRGDTEYYEKAREHFVKPVEKKPLQIEGPKAAPEQPQAVPDLPPIITRKQPLDLPFVPPPVSRAPKKILPLPKKIPDFRETARPKLFEIKKGEKPDAERIGKEIKEGRPPERTERREAEPVRVRDTEEGRMEAPKAEKEVAALGEEILKQAKKTDPGKGHLISVSELRSRMKKIPKKDFDQAVLKLSKEKKIFLHKHVFADQAREQGTIDNLVHDKQKNSYYMGLVIRKGEGKLSGRELKTSGLKPEPKLVEPKRKIDIENLNELYNRFIKNPEKAQSEKAYLEDVIKNKPELIKEQKFGMPPKYFLNIAWNKYKKSDVYVAYQEGIKQAKERQKERERYKPDRATQAKRESWEYLHNKKMENRRKEVDTLSNKIKEKIATIRKDAILRKEAGETEKNISKKLMPKLNQAMQDLKWIEKYGMDTGQIPPRDPSAKFIKIPDEIILRYGKPELERIKPESIETQIPVSEKSAEPTEKKTPPSKRQELEDSIAEGELILKTGEYKGVKQDQSFLDNIQEIVDNTKKRLETEIAKSESVRGKYETPFDLVTKWSPEKIKKIKKRGEERGFFEGGEATEFIGERGGYKLSINHAFDKMVIEHPNGAKIEKAIMPDGKENIAVEGNFSQLEKMGFDKESFTFDDRKLKSFFQFGEKKPEQKMLENEVKQEAIKPVEVESSKIQSAYEKLKTETGFSSVNISDLQKKSGVPLKELHEFIKKEPRAIPAMGDWSLSSESERAAAIDINGKPHLLVKLKPKVEPSIKKKVPAPSKEPQYSLAPDADLYPPPPKPAQKTTVRERREQIKEIDAKDAKYLIREFIMKRRAYIAEEAFQTNKFIDKIKTGKFSGGKRLSIEQEEVIPFMIEKTPIPEKLKRPDLEKIDQSKLTGVKEAAKEHFEEAWEFLKKHKDELSVDQIENYVTHIWDLGPKQSNKVTNWAMENSFLKKRYIKTLYEGVEKLELKPKELAITDIIRVHDSMMHRVIANKKFVDDIFALKKEGINLIMRADKKEIPHDWVAFDHPAVRKKIFIPGEPIKEADISMELKEILIDIGAKIGRKINKNLKYEGKYHDRVIQVKKIFEDKTLTHEIGHYLDEKLKLGNKWAEQFKNELMVVNQDRIAKFKDKDYASSNPELVAEFFAEFFLNPKKTAKLAPNAMADITDKMGQDGALQRLVDFDFESKIKDTFIKQTNTIVNMGVKVHPDIYEPLKVVLDSYQPHYLTKAYDDISGFLKKFNLSASFFHALTITEGGLLFVPKWQFLKTNNPIAYVYKGMVKGEKAAFKNAKEAQDGIKHGLQIGAAGDFPVHKIQRAFNDLAGRSRNTPGMKQATKILATMNERWDNALWDYLHDANKIAAYENLKKYIDPAKDITKQKKEIAQIVNDVYGGQNFDNLMMNPTTVRWMGRTLLSPDWTTSTMRQAMAFTGLGKVYPETAFLRRKVGRQLWVKAAIYFGILYNAYNMAMRVYDQKKNPEKYKFTDPKTGKVRSLSLKKDLMDYTLMGNAPGHKWDLFSGRYDDGTEQYLRVGKQFKELPEAIFDHGELSPISATIKRIGTKVSPPIGFLSQAFTGYSLSGFRNPDIAEKKNWERAKGIFKLLLKTPLPYSVQSAMSEYKGWTPSSMFLPSSKGMSRYQAKQYFKRAIEQDDEVLFYQTYRSAYSNNVDGFAALKSAWQELQREKSRKLRGINKGIEEIKAEYKAERDPVTKAALGSILVSMRKEQKGIEGTLQNYQKAQLYFKEKISPGETLDTLKAEYKIARFDVEEAIRNGDNDVAVKIMQDHNRKIIDKEKYSAEERKKILFTEQKIRNLIKRIDKEKGID
jgi:hypothetical protein